MLPRCQTRWLWSFFAACLLISYASQALYSGERVRVAHNERNLLRLHVLANSDSARDQEVKLAVRDALIARLGELAADGRNAEEVEGNVRRAERILVSQAEKTLRSLGESYPVRMEIGDHVFGMTRDAKHVLGPGEYRSIRVVIGEGAGKNWWCVLFPPSSLAHDDASIAVAVVDSRRTNKDGVPVEIRWRFLTYLNRQSLTHLADLARRPFEAAAKSRAVEAHGLGGHAHR